LSKTKKTTPEVQNGDNKATKPITHTPPFSPKPTPTQRRDGKSNQKQNHMMKKYEGILSRSVRRR